MDGSNAATALRLGIVSCVVPAAELGGAFDRLIAALAQRWRRSRNTCALLQRWSHAARPTMALVC
jgi:enoyl-CoA hydratase/carnithine racemase